MSESTELGGRLPREPLFGVHDVPEQTLETYARLWQLETWLRQLVYVHLRAKLGDAWDMDVQRAEGPKNQDKRLVHMPTEDESPLSFAQLSELRRLIGANWALFESYLPPKAIWEAKLDEVAQIRHRIAHFRSAHEDDLRRVVQLLRDLDTGFWRFCTAYNDPQPVLPASDDPIVTAFLHLDLFPWTEVRERGWARIGSAPPGERFTVSVEVLRMPWAQGTRPIAGREGFLYDVNIHARGEWRFDFARLLASTKVHHKHLVHICLDSDERVFRFTLPACLGEAAVTRLITALHEAALNAVSPARGVPADGQVQAVADRHPEHVLGPSNPLTFLSPDMPCTFFSA